MKQIKKYYAKTLFSGKVVGKDGDFYVGIPGGQQYDTKQNFSKDKNFKVVYNGEYMLIANWHKAEAFRKFDDISGRGTYTLAYFEWKPIKEPEQTEINLSVKQRLAKEFFDKHPELRRA